MSTRFWSEGSSARARQCQRPGMRRVEVILMRNSPKATLVMVVAGGGVSTYVYTLDTPSGFHNVTVITIGSYITPAVFAVLKRSFPVE